MITRSCARTGFGAASMAVTTTASKTAIDKQWRAGCEASVATEAAPRGTGRFIGYSLVIVASLFSRTPSAKMGPLERVLLFRRGPIRQACSVVVPEHSPLVP